MAKSIKLPRVTFLPADVAEITGVGVGLQRTWRHQGYSDTTRGANWTRHSLLQTAALLVQGELQKRGIPPRTSYSFARFAAPRILDWLKTEPRPNPRGTGASRRGTPARFLVHWGLSKRDRTLTSNLNSLYETRHRENLSAAIVIDLRLLADHLRAAAQAHLASRR
jgi:hypothetical protein